MIIRLLVVLKETVLDLLKSVEKMQIFTVSSDFTFVLMSYLIRI